MIWNIKMKLHLIIILTLVLSLSVFGQKKSEKTEEKYPLTGSGKVEVEVTIDEKGDVISARALSGPRLLRKPSEEAASKSKFKPTILKGEAIRVKGIIVYNFVASRGWENIGSSLSDMRSEVFSKPLVLDKDDPIWKNMKPEQAEYIALLTDVSNAEKPLRAAGLTETIREKLKLSDPSNLWKFDLGFIISKLKNAEETAENSNDFQSSLRELAQIIKTAPSSIPPKRLTVLTKAAKFSETQNLSKDKRKEIVKLLVDSQN